MGLRSFFLLLISFVAACGAGDDGTDSSEEGLAVSAEAAQAYAKIARDAGATVSAGRVTVVGLRGLDLQAHLHDTISARAFDDSLVVLRADGTARKYAASTHPWEKSLRGLPDANGDGQPDVGMLRPGRYSVVGREPARNIAGLPTYAIGTATSGSVPSWRDTDHDGVVSGDERARSEARGDRMSAVLFHKGGEGAPAAVGCQVMSAEDLRSFVADVGGARARFEYVLVDAHALDPVVIAGL